MQWDGGSKVPRKSHYVQSGQIAKVVTGTVPLEKRGEVVTDTYTIPDLLSKERAAVCLMALMPVKVKVE